ncbi:predicted protein [Naegleria gruberi]|uniref:Predicted protein n=1 Tax=Naegleria gruberi TaxID=5762 RepID=D2VN41_NAEGR|nr:uncharacterized protein NAEGRDRAFT_70363 [Naegleria gruberi]EFC41929.1 predicted protein [Naegleria gruberi]|eukprot:XP_002674673.1 predicted protein [Naegleria gruberi strain NEG-M]
MSKQFINNNNTQIAITNEEIASSTKDRNDILTTTTKIEQQPPSSFKEVKQKGWFYWFKADDDHDSEDEDFDDDDTENFSNKFITKDWSDMNLFEKTLSIGEKLGYHVANILGITDSKFQVEKVEYQSVSILLTISNNIN